MRAKQQQQSTDDKTNSQPPLIVPGAVWASAVASGLGTACLSPKARPAIVALLSTNAASELVQQLMAKHPNLTLLKPLELLAFMTAVGWIYYSGFFHPDSYQKSHMRLILKYVLLTQPMASSCRTSTDSASIRTRAPCATRASAVGSSRAVTSSRA